MNYNKEIYCTLGPSTLNSNFLKFSNKRISLLRLNMSHIETKQLKKKINFIRKFSRIPICIDTEGAQIRSKIKIKKKYKIGNDAIIYEKNGNFKIYPLGVFNKIKKDDLLDIGFDGLQIKVKKKTKEKLICKVTKSGLLENNKGIHIKNRNIKLNYITEKDKEAIKIAKKMKIKHFALSFTNSHKDILKFNKLLKDEIKFFKIETRSAINNLDKIISLGKRFLIDRGDLSNDISVKMLPLAQRKILKTAKKKGKKVYVATNFLESMMNNNYPTRGEANDIYNTLEMGADGVVLAAETAIGKHPKDCVIFLQKLIKIYMKYK